MSNSYSRVDYTKANGDASSAYLSPDKKTAYDVYTNTPVNLSGDATEGYKEWRPPVESKQEPHKQAHKQAQKQAKAVRIVPTIRVWQIPVVAAFGLAMIWLETQFPSMLGY